MIGKKNYFKIRNIGTFKNANFVGDEDLMEKLLEFFFTKMSYHQLSLEPIRHRI